MREVTDGVPGAAGASQVPVQGRASGLAAALAALDATGTEARAAAGRFRSGRDVEEGRDRARPNAAAPVRPRWQDRYTRLLVLCDGVAAVGGTLVAARLTTPVPAWVAAVAGLAVVGAVTLNRAYEHRFLGHGPDELRRVWTACVSLLAVTGVAGYALDAGDLRGLVVVGLPLASAGVLAVHGAARFLLGRMRRAGRCVQRCVVIGSERSVAELVRATRSDGGAGLAVVGACVAASRGETVEGVPVLGPPAQAYAALRGVRGDTIVLTAWSDVAQEDLRRLSWDLEGTGTQLLVAPRLAEVAAPRMHIRTVHGQPLLNVEEPEFSGLRRLAKKGLDLGLAVPALVVLAPLLLAVAVAVRATSPGPVLFRQERVGRHGRPFRMTKFRSMYLDAEQRLAHLEHLNDHGGGPLFKMREDPRVTPVGRFLRRYSLDELPQLFDVVAGRMSLVGPRPPLPREVSRYEQDVRRRLLVKPGITGLWQVSGRSDLSWEESVRLDLSYVENWSLWLDLRIIARTVTAVLARDGAY